MNKELAFLLQCQTYRTELLYCYTFIKNYLTIHYFSTLTFKNAFSSCLIYKTLFVRTMPATEKYRNLTIVKSILDVKYSTFILSERSTRPVSFSPEGQTIISSRVTNARPTRVHKRRSEHFPTGANVVITWSALATCAE